MVHSPLLNESNDGAFGWLDSNPTSGGDTTFTLRAWSAHPSVPGATYSGYESGNVTFSYNTDNPPVLKNDEAARITITAGGTIGAVTAHNSRYGNALAFLFSDPVIASAGDTIVIPAGALKLATRP